jgi:hypothetical protein
MAQIKRYPLETGIFTQVLYSNCIFKEINLVVALRKS